MSCGCFAADKLVVNPELEAGVRGGHINLFQGATFEDNANTHLHNTKLIIPR